MPREEESTTSSRVIGRYLLCDPIASGGMATVHLGRLVGPAGFSRTVAIKRLHPHFARDPEFVAMFLDEARLAARIRHPNVVSTIDVVVLKGELFVVMDYVHGEALSRLVRTAGPLPLAIAASIISGVLYGLHAAHEARTDDGTPLHIVHRDVSPQNVLVGVDGVARVVDFGVAKAVGRLQTTREGALKGKISYMSPEQVSSDSVDRRCDVYAASVVLWEMLTGRRLYSADNEVRIIQQVLNGNIDPPSKYAALPRDFDALVMKGLARKPEDRFATAYEMAEQVQRLAFATPGQVSAWVATTCGAAIDARARKVAEVESTPASAPKSDDDDVSDEDETVAREVNPPLAAPVVKAIARRSIPDAPPGIPMSEAPLVDSQVSALNVSSSAGRRAVFLGRRFDPRWVVLVAAVATILGATIVLAFVLGRSTTTTPTTTVTSGAPPSTTTTTPPAAPSTPPSSVARTVEIVESPIATVSAHATSTTKSPPTHAAPPRPRSTCDPPYTIKDGIRVPKMECL